ncbi:MAG: hypothetical protein V2A73_20260 [Pseudomonadota bacterium]
MESEKTQKKDPELKRYGKTIGVLYAVVMACSCGLIVASILHELFFRRVDSLPEPTTTDLAGCSSSVRSLLEDLGKTVAWLQQEAVTGNPENIAARWESFSGNWQERWNSVNRQCRFEKLANTGLGQTFDRMAWVHQQLPIVKLKYREMMKRYTEEQVAELTAIRRVLDRIEKQHSEHVGSRPSSSQTGNQEE